MAGLWSPILDVYAGIEPLSLPTERLPHLRGIAPIKIVAKYSR
jgi:hypothetical protein